MIDGFRTISEDRACGFIWRKTNNVTIKSNIDTTFAWFSINFPFFTMKEMLACYDYKQ